MATETTKLAFIEGAAPATPAASRAVIYAKADGLMYSKDDAGVETLMSGGSGGAPTNADYLVGTANGSLSAEIVVGTSPGGELGGTWASPTVDATHSGSAHSIVQVKTAISTADDSTTAATLQNSSLSLAFTPLFADSILHISVDGECSAVRAAGSPAIRGLEVSIQNSTDTVDVVTNQRDITLVAGSSVAAIFITSIGLKGIYTVNSLTARTFRLRYRSLEATNVQAGITGSRAGGVIMTITEVRP